MRPANDGPCGPFEAQAMLEVNHLTSENERGPAGVLARWPEGAESGGGTLEWCVAQASVEQPGPLSSHPGFERVLVITAGAGFVLEHGNCAPRVRLRPLEPYRFAGDWPTTVELPAGSAQGLDVIARRGSGLPQVAALRLGRRRAREPIGPGHVLAHVLDGAATARVTGEEEAFHLEAGDSLWIRGLLGGEELDLVGSSPACVVLLVRIGAGADRAL